MVKANVDKILDLLSQKNSISTGELSKELKIKESDIQKSAEYLEQDGVVKIERKWPRTVITLIHPKPNSSMPPPPQSAIPQMNLGMPPPPKIMSQPQGIPVNAANEQAQLNLNTQNNLQFQDTSLKNNSQLQNEVIQTETTTVETTQRIQNFEQTEAPKLNLDQTLFDFKREEPNSLVTSSEENLRLAKTLMTGSDPLDAKPRFDMNAPEPMVSSSSSFANADPNMPLFSDAANISFPPYIRTDTERVSYIMDHLDQKLNSRDFTDLTSFYRKLYSLYNESDMLSPNERYLFGEKIQELFERIKKIYLVEKAI